MGFKIPSVVSIAGSDSSGGAGIQADLKTIEALGLFAQTAITALTAQNTMGVSGVLDVPSEFVVQQIDAVFEDIRPGAVKIGMVSSALNVVAIAESLRAHAAENIVVDPVMVSTSGSRLISDGASEALTGRLFPLASVITPNIPEVEVLWGRGIATKRDMEAAAGELSERFGVAVLVKGGQASSRSEARRAVTQGGVSVEGEKITDIATAYVPADFEGEGKIVKKGKKNFVFFHKKTIRHHNRHRIVGKSSLYRMFFSVSLSNR